MSAGSLRIYDPGVGGTFCRVLISESPHYAGYLAVSVLYATGKGPAIATNLKSSESDAISWAEDWLAKKYGGTPKLGVALP